MPASLFSFPLIINNILNIVHHGRNKRWSNKRNYFGDTEIFFYTDYISVNIGVTDSSILDKLIYSYKDCYGLHPYDIATMAWKDHNNLMEELYEDDWDLD